MSDPKFKCWFPVLGQSEAQAISISACDAKQAAEKAAEKKCWDDVEWVDHLVAVLSRNDDALKKFDVQVESRPHFTAIRST